MGVDSTHTAVDRPGTAPAPADLTDALFALCRRWPRVWQVPGVPEASVSVVRGFRGRATVALSVGDVAAAVAVAPSTASRLVDSAVRSGHVVKERRAGGSRFSAVRLTDAGRALLLQVEAAERRLLAQATPGWSARDRWSARRFIVDIAGGLLDVEGAGTVTVPAPRSASGLVPTPAASTSSPPTSSGAEVGADVAL